MENLGEIMECKNSEILLKNGTLISEYFWSVEIILLILFNHKHLVILKQGGLFHWEFAGRKEYFLVQIKKIVIFPH